MRYILILLALTLGLQGFSQWSRPNQNYGSRAYRWGMDSTLYFPTGCGTPSGITGLRLTQANGSPGTNLNQGAIYFDSCASKVWFYDPKLQTWIAGSGGGGGTVYMDTAYSRNDSLFGFKDGVEFWTGGLVGGKNFANADLTATGDRYHNFKGYGLTIDSVSAVFIGQESDTASAQVNMEGTGFISDKYRTIPSVSGGGLTEFSNATSGLVSMSTTVSGVGYGFPFSANSIKLKSSMPFEPSYSKNGVFVSADSIFLNNDNDESQAYAPRTSDTTNYLPLLMDRTTGALVPCLTCDFGGGGTGRLNSITANFPLKIDSTDPINPIVYADTLGGASALSNRGHSQYLIDSLAALKVPKTTTVAGFPLNGNVTLASLTPGYGMTGSTYDGSVARTFVTDSTLFATKAFSNNSYLPVGSAWLTNASNTGGAIRFGLASNNSIRFVNNSTEKMVIDSLGNVGIGTSAPTARVHSLSTTEQFRLGFDVSNYMSATVSGTGATTLNTTGSSEQFIFSDRITSNVAAGAVAFSSNGTSANSNFLVYGSSVGASTSSELLYGGATTTYNRAFMRGGTNAAIPTSGGASTLTIGTNDYTKAASGIHGLFSQAVIKPLTISGSGATVTNAAGIYIEDGPTGATNNYPIWVAGTNGSVRFDVPLVVGGTTPSASAIGEFVSTTKGVLLPRMTGAQMNAISSPGNGMIVYNTDSSAFCYYSTVTSAWRRVGSASAAGSTGQIQYNNSNFFAASSNFTFDPAGGTSGALTVTGKILLGDTLRGLVAGTNTPYLFFGASGLRLQGLANSFITMASNAVGVTGALTSNTSFTALTNATFNTTANVGTTVQHGIYRAAGSFSSGSASAGQSSFYKFYGTVSGGTIPKTMWLHDSAIVNGVNITDYSSAVLNPNVTGNYTGIRIAPTGVTGLNIALAAESGSSIFGGATPNASAVVEARSTTKGFLPPVMTTVQKNAIVSPAIGLIVFDTTLMKLCVYTTVWETITSL